MRIGVGTMTGTSMDGIDAVAVHIDGAGIDMKATYLSMASVEMGELRDTLQQLAMNDVPTKEGESAALALGNLTTKAIQALHLQHIDFIALHGQTIFHKPPTSIQLINPELVIRTFDCNVYTDPRRQDLLLGGEGAPITPLADWVMFRSEDESTAIVNLGGFCNVTLLPAGCTTSDIEGFDVCSCNLLLNTISQHAWNEPFDRDGTHALQGTIDSHVKEKILQALSAQHTANRSLGTDDELGEYALDLGKHLTPEDLLASATSAIGACISQAVVNIDRVFLAGGGIHNKSLFGHIRNQGTTDVLGVPTQAREGMAMAILSALAQDGVSITLPQITGRRCVKETVGWTQVNP